MSAKHLAPSISQLLPDGEKVTREASGQLKYLAPSDFRILAAKSPLGTS